jgi:hypothetical protein
LSFFGRPPTLPRSRLNNLGIRLSGLGRLKEAPAAFKKAVEIYRALVKDCPGAFLPDLARSLDAMFSVSARLRGVLSVLPHQPAQWDRWTHNRRWHQPRHQGSSSRTRLLGGWRRGIPGIPVVWDLSSQRRRRVQRTQKSRALPATFRTRMRETQTGR